MAKRKASEMLRHMHYKMRGVTEAEVLYALNGPTRTEGAGASYNWTFWLGE